MEESKNKEDAPVGGLKMEICFIIFGVSSLLAWNAIISDISFFINYLGKYDPSTSFAFFNFFLNIIFQLIMIWKKQLLSYKSQLIFGLIASIVFLVVLPIVVISFEKDSLTGFLLAGGIILIQGLINAFCSSGFFGLTSFFPMDMIISLSTGQGISGILMNIISYIVIASINTGNNDEDAELGAIIFFVISGFILLVTLIILFFAFRTDYFRFFLGNTKGFDKNNSNIEKIEDIENQGLTKPSIASENNEELIEHQKQPETEVKEEEITFLKLFKKLYEIDLLSCWVYVVTFALFPSVSISQRLFKTGKYRQITIITIYNVADTIGRSIMSGFKFKRGLAYIIIIGRTILIATLILNFYFDMKLGMDPTLSSVLLIINVTILAITNGMGTTICLGLAPSMVPDSMKGRAGSSISFFNILGIFLGTCVAFLTKYIINQIGEYHEEE